MVLVDGDSQSLELTDQLRWFEQSTDPFVRSLVRVAYGVRGRGAAQYFRTVVRLCMDLVVFDGACRFIRRYSINPIKSMT